MAFTVTEIPNEQLGDEVVRVYGPRLATIDGLLCAIMRNHLREEDQQGFGMCDAYLITHNESGKQAVLMIWANEAFTGTQCVSQTNYYSGTPTLKTLSLAAHLIAFSNLSFALHETAETDPEVAAVAQKVADSYHVLRNYVGNGCELFTDDEIVEMFKIID